MINTIYNRRSVRKYLDKPVKEDDLNEILKAGMYAPSAVNKQPWHFIVIKDKKILNDIKNIHPYSTSLQTAPIAIIVCGDTELEFAKDFYLSDCAAVTQNILLAAKELGLDTCWMGIFPWEKLTEDFEKYFKLPANVKPYSVIALGYGAEEKARPERFDKSKIHIDKW